MTALVGVGRIEDVLSGTLPALEMAVLAPPLIQYVQRGKMAFGCPSSRQEGIRWGDGMGR